MFGTPAYDTVTDLAVDNLGHVYVTGTTAGDLDGGGLRGTQDGFIAVLTANLTTGFTLTSKFQWGTAGISRIPGGIAYCTDSAGTARLYVTGTDADSGSGKTAWISWFDPLTITAGPRQTQTEPGPGLGGAWSYGRVTTDAQCNPYVTGSASNAIQGSALSNFVIQKYDSQLANTASLEIDGPSKGVFGTVNTSSIALDGLNNIYVSGTVTGPQDLFGQTIKGQFAVWYAAYDSIGKRLRSGVVDAGPGPGSGTQTTGGYIALDPCAGIYLGGSSDSTLADLQSNGFFLAQYSPAVLNPCRYPTASPAALLFPSELIGDSKHLTVQLLNGGKVALNIDLNNVSIGGDSAVSRR